MKLDDDGHRSKCSFEKRPAFLNYRDSNTNQFCKCLWLWNGTFWIVSEKQNVKPPEVYRVVIQYK